MKKEITLYNVLFPLWMLLLFPQLWWIVLPGNFIIDSLVLFLAMLCLKMEEKKLFYKETIWKIFGFGLLSDFVGAAYLLILIAWFEVGRMGDELWLTLPAVGISAVCIFLLNYFVTFKKCAPAVRLRLALTFAVFTAPYTFLVPSAWLYGF